MSARSALLLGALTNWLAFAAQIAVSFFMCPYLLQVLGTERYAVWSVVEAVLAYATLLDLGIAACVVRDVARFRATSAWADLNRTCSSSLAVFVLMGAVLAALGGLFAPGLVPNLDRVFTAPTQAQWFVGLLVVNLATMLPLSLFPAVLDGLERFAIKSLTRLVLLALRVTIIVNWPGTFGLVELAALFTGLNLLEGGLLAALSFYYLPTLRLTWGRLDGATLRRVAGYSVDAFLILLANRLAVQSDPLIIGWCLPLAQVTYFALAARLVETVKGLLRTICTTLTPAMSAKDATGDHTGLQHLFTAATKWLLYVALPVQMGLWLFGRAFLTLWLGDSAYADAAYPTLVVLALPLAVSVAQSVALRVLYGVGELTVYARLTLVEAGVKLALAFGLIYVWGIVGIAWATAVPALCMGAVAIRLAYRRAGLSGWTYLRTCWVGPVQLLALATLGWLVGLQLLPLDCWAHLLVVGGGGCVVYALAVVRYEARTVARWLAWRGVRLAADKIEVPPTFHAAHIKSTHASGTRRERLTNCH
jgi:O-antigen/teichoic acid export membrane protein